MGWHCQIEVGDKKGTLSLGSSPGLQRTRLGKRLLDRALQRDFSSGEEVGWLFCLSCKDAAE